MNTANRPGKIYFNGIQPKLHEYAAYLTLVNQGKTIKLLPVSTKYKKHSPDFLMDGKKWELKCPQGKGKYVIRDTLRQASKQAAYIVIDIRRLKLNHEKAINQLNKYFALETKLKHMLIITKQKSILDIHK